MLFSLTGVAVAYVSASASLTLMVPWYNISATSAFSTAYEDRGWQWAQYVVSVGALAAMIATLTSMLLLVPRYLYAMARDGLLISLCGKVNERSGVR